jgi:hypothetical protein
VNCKETFSAHAADKKDDHKCQENMEQKLTSQTEDEKIKRFVTSYELKPTPIQALSLIIIEKNCAYSLADSEYIPKLLQSWKTPESNIEHFYDSKVTECIKDMGWEKTAKNRMYFAEVGCNAVSIDSVDIGNKHLTIVVTHNALQLRHYLQDNIGAKMKDIDPVLKPSLLTITPDVSDGKSFCSLAFLIMDILAEEGNSLKIIVGDGLPVQYDTLYLGIKEHNLRSIHPMAKGLPQYHLCFFHTISLSVTRVRSYNDVFQAFNSRMKRIIKILRRKRFQEYLGFKIRPLLKWRSLSTCDSMEDLIDMRLPLQTLLNANEQPVAKQHLAGFEVQNGLAGLRSEELMCIVSNMDDVDDVMQVQLVTIDIMIMIICCYFYSS